MYGKIWRRGVVAVGGSVALAVTGLSVGGGAVAAADPVTSLHYAANGNFPSGTATYSPGSDGFNLADDSSKSVADALGSVKSLIYVGTCNGADSTFTSTITPYIGDGHIFGFYLMDEPNPASCSPANIKAESDWIHANDPGAKTFIVAENTTSNSNPTLGAFATSDLDLIGLDPYPVRTTGYDTTMIPNYVAAAEAQGIPQSKIVPVYQAFGNYPGGNWAMPTPSQETQLLQQWGSVVPNPVFDYTYSWGTQSGDQALSGDSALQSVFSAHNGASGPAPSTTTTAPPATTTTAPPSTTTTAPPSTTTTAPPSPTTTTPATTSPPTGGHHRHWSRSGRHHWRRD